MLDRILRYLGLSKFRDIHEHALKSARIGTWSVDLKTNIIQISPVTAEIFHIPLINDDLSSAINRLIHPEDQERVRLAVQKSIEESVPYEIEYRINRLDGEVRWIFTRGMVSRDDSGIPIRFSGVSEDITNRKQSELFDRAEKKMFEEIFYGSRVALVIFRGPELRYEMINDNYKKIIGDRDVIGKPLLEALPEIRDSEFPRIIRKVFETGEVVETFEQPSPLLDPKTGEISIRYFDTAFSRIPGATPEDTLVFNHSVDVTERVKSKNQILGLQERFSRFTRAADLGVWYCDLPFAVLTWDRQVKAHFWLSADAHVTINVFYERIHPEDRDRTRKAIEFSIENHTPYDIIYRTTNPQNHQQVKYIRAIGWTDYDSNNSPIRFDGVTLDVSHHRENEEYFRTLVDTSPTMIWMTDADSKCTYLSQRWYDFTGRTPEQDLGFGWLENIHPEDLENTARLYTEATANYGRLEIEYRLRRHDGEYRWAIDVGLPRFSSTGVFMGYIGTVIDIHDRKLFEDKLQEAVKARDVFLSIASHELKTPLTSLSLQTQLIGRMAEKSEAEAFDLGRMKKFLTHTTRATAKLSHLVDDMLDISRISTGKIFVEKEDFDLGILTKEISERMEEEFAAAGCPFTLDLVDGVVGHWDKFRIEQVISNLYSNAIKYAKKTPVTVSLQSDGKVATWSITDEGPGIPEEAQQRIFERFERAGSKNDIKGLGLGLFICQQIVHMHGGTIGVKSSIGEGSTFRFDLPL